MGDCFRPGLAIPDCAAHAELRRAGTDSALPLQIFTSTFKAKYVTCLSQMDWKDKGNEKFKAGLFSEALACYNTALDSDKDNAVLYR